MPSEKSFLISGRWGWLAMGVVVDGLVNNLAIQVCKPFKNLTAFAMQTSLHSIYN